MCLFEDISYACTTRIQKRREKMLEIALWGAWFLLGAYACWFVSKAKTFQPLTLNELALTWRLHKHEAQCKASSIHELLVRNDEIVGFKCDCGYKFLQKRLITQKVHPREQNNKPPFSARALNMDRPKCNWIHKRSFNRGFGADHIRFVRWNSNTKQELGCECHEPRRLQSQSGNDHDLEAARAKRRESLFFL